MAASDSRTAGRAAAMQENPVTRRVRDIMKTEVTSVSPDTTMPELQRVFVKTGYGAVPVLDRDRRLVGIVSRSDVVRKASLEQSLAELADSDFDAILGVEDNDDALQSIGAAVGRRLANVRASDIMITKVVTIDPDEGAADAARQMVERRIHRLPVLDGGRLVGIVSAFDFMTVYAEEN
jgi:CBS domain-containing protein